MGTVLFHLLVGAVVGLLGKLLAPGGRDNIPLWLTVPCGVGGMLLGGAVYRAFGGDGSPGIDWTRAAVMVLTAAVLVMVAASITARRA